MAIVDTRVRPELLDASDETIEDAVRYADPMVLRGLLYQLTADQEIARTQLKTVQRGFGEAQTVASEEDLALLQGKAADFLKAYRDAGAGEISIGPEDRLHKSLELAAGLEFTEDDMGLCMEELALNPWARSLEWSETPDPQRLEGFNVAVIGAGMGGLNAALQLKRAGIPYTVFEKNSDVGGTWYENRYPGARVDTLSRAYTNIFGVDFEYPNPFCPWTENESTSIGSRTRSSCATRSSSTPRCARSPGTRPPREWEIVLDGPEGERTVPRERRDHGGRLPQPAEHPRDRGHARTSAGRRGTRPAGPRASRSRASASP